MTIDCFSFGRDRKLCREAEQSAYCSANSVQTISETIVSDLNAQIERTPEQGMWASQR